MQMHVDYIQVDLDKLACLRAESHMSLSDVSFYLGYKTPTGYWLIEAGQRGVSVGVLYLLSQLYGKKMEDFIIVKQEEPEQ